MKAEKIHQDDIFLVGMRTPLASSLSENLIIIKNFWKQFNVKLKSVHMPMTQPWIKYGITLYEHEQYYYFCGVLSNQCYPLDFELLHIPRGSFLQYIHTGSMDMLTQTINTVWKQELPNSPYKTANTNIRYFEVYKEGFSFQSSDSTIFLYIPLQEDEKKEFLYLPAKTILAGSGAQPGKSYANSWFGMDFNMNLYKGCCHGCVYCDSRSKCYQVTDFDIVKGKQNAIQILETELYKKRKKGTIGIGAMSDTYNPFEKELGITRKALELIMHYGYGVGIDTKSTLILRDIDILKQIAKQYPSIFKITITCAEDSLSKLIEPFAPVSSKRFETVKALREAGLFTGILLMPILPFINDTEENILSIVHKAHDAHANFIFVYGGFSLTLRDNQRDYYYHWLDQQYPGLRFTYEEHYHKCYSCNSPHSRRLSKLFQKECQKYGILYRMSDIIRAYKPSIPNEQMQLKL